MLAIGTLLARHDTGELDEDERDQLNAALVERLVRYTMQPDSGRLTDGGYQNPRAFDRLDVEAFRERLAYGEVAV